MQAAIDMTRIMRPVMNLRIFDLNTNTTGDAGMSPEMKTYYEKRLIELAEPDLIHDQFCDKYPIPQGNGKTIEFRKFNALPKSLTPLTEGVTPDGRKLTVTSQTATVEQYGDFVALSDVLQLTTIDPIVVQATRAVASQASRTLDTISREVMNAGTNVLYAPESDGTAVTLRTGITSDCLVTFDVLRMAATILKRQNAPKIDGSYVAIVHPDVAHDIMSEKDGWVDVNKYSNAEKIFEGEIGKIAGIRVVENTEAKIFMGGGASSGNVYSTLVLGAGACATTEITGGGLQHFVKPKGSAGTGDPIDQRSTVGWKATKVTEILVQQYMVRIESSSSMAASAIAN